MRSRSVEFVLVVEAGILEAQAVLLCESIRSFAGVYSSSQITAVSPRKSRRPSNATLKKFAKLDVEYLPIEATSCCPEYGPSYRVHSVAHVARRSGPPILVQVDSDTIFLSEPELSLSETDAAARPVDVKGMCTTGSNDPFNEYWKAVDTLAGVDCEQAPLVLTTVDGQTVRANYNGGLVAARRTCGIFQQTEQLFTKIVATGLKPWRAEAFSVKTGTGTVTNLSAAFWGTSQAAFSVAALKGGHKVMLLPSTHNLPLHFLDKLMPIPVPLVHIHYHWLCSAGEGDGRKLLDARLQLSPATVEWLEARLPLSPP